MAERHILLTAYSPVSSNTFHERLNQIEKSLAYLKLSEKNTKEELEKVKLEVNNLEEIKIEINKIELIQKEIDRLEEIKKKINQINDELIKIEPNKQWRLLFDTINKVWKPKVENSEFKKLHLNHAYTTSESAFKELVIPFDKREVLDDKKIDKREPCKIEKVFAFTTRKVKNFSLKDTYYHNGDEIINLNNESATDSMKNEEFIESRFQAIHKFADNGIEKLEFEHLLVEESGVNPTASIKSVLEMVELIESYIKKHEGDEFIIHADMSGGFRHIPLILMLVLNILQRTNHNIGEIIYTMLLEGEVKIERINDIFDMQRFTNGVHEFIEFGSGEELGNYYNLSKKKTDLEDSSEDYDKKISAFIDAVNGFSEAITLSDRNEFRKAVKGIERAWEQLEEDISGYDIAKKLDKQNRERNKTEERIPSAIENNLGLLQTFSPRIKEEYEQLWKTDNELDYILWCLDHNFIQQALTLYSEILPEALLGGEHPIIRINFEEDLLDVYNKNKDVYGFHFWALNHFSWDKVTKMNNKEKVEEIDKEQDKKKSKLDELYEKLSESIEVDYIEMPWTRKRKLVEYIGNELKQNIYEGIQSKLNDLRKKPNFMNDLRDIVIEMEESNPLEIYKFFLNKLGEVIDFDKQNFMSRMEEELKMFKSEKLEEESTSTFYAESLKTIKIDAKKQESLIISLAKIFAYPTRMYNILKNLQAKLENNNFYNIEKKGRVSQNIIEYIKTNYYQESDYYDSLVTLYILTGAINKIGSVHEFLEKWDGEERDRAVRNKYFLFNQLSKGLLSEIFMPFTYEKKVLFPYRLSKLDEGSLIKSLYSYLCAKKIELNVESWAGNKEKILLEMKRILAKYISGIDEESDWRTLLPKSLNGDLEEEDINGASYLELLFLRSIFIPYRFFKQVRNESVHARTDRNELIDIHELSELLEQSVKWIKLLQNRVN